MNSLPKNQEKIGFKVQKLQQSVVVKGTRNPVNNNVQNPIIKTKIQSEPANLRNTTQEIDNDFLRLQQLQFLKLYDMDKSYGPCLGLTRQDRVNRARKYGIGRVEILDQVEAMLEQHRNDSDYRECLWYKILK